MTFEIMPDENLSEFASRLIAGSRNNGGYDHVTNVLSIVFAPMVRSLAYNIVNDREATEEIVNDTFLSMHLHFPSYEERGQFSSWLYRIVENKAINFLKSRKKRGIYLNLDNLPSEYLNSESLIAHNPNPEQELEGKELADLVEESIEGLPLELRRVIVSSIEGQSYEEIAENLGIPLGTVKSRLNRTRAIVRRRLEAVV